MAKVGLPDQLSIVVVCDGRVDHVYTRREVDDSRSRGRGVACTRSTTVTRGDGSVDCGSIVRLAITLGTEILDIAVHLVGRWVGVEGSNAAVLDVIEPVCASVGGSCR
jgi:hypothetical protein